MTSWTTESARRTPDTACGSSNPERLGEAVAASLRTPAVQAPEYSGLPGDR